MWRRRQLGTKVSRSPAGLHDVLRDRPWLMGRQIRIPCRYRRRLARSCRARLVGRFHPAAHRGHWGTSTPRSMPARNVTSTTLRVSTSPLEDGCQSLSVRSHLRAARQQSMRLPCWRRCLTCDVRSYGQICRCTIIPSRHYHNTLGGTRRARSLASRSSVRNACSGAASRSTRGASTMARTRPGPIWT